MKRVVLVASSIALFCAAIAEAAPDGVPARPRSIGRWYDHDPKEPQAGYEAWSPADAAGFLELYPDAYLEVPFNDGKPAGFRKAHEMADQVRALKSILIQRGVDARGRVCMSGDRPDVQTRLFDDTGPCNPRNGGGGCDWEGDMDGSHGEAETFVKVASRVTAGTPTGLVDTRSNWQTDLYYRRLLVLRPGSGSEEQRRIVANDASSLTVEGAWRSPPRSGDRYEVRGSFDPAWVKQIPLSAHQQALQEYWPSVRNVCGSSPCAPPTESLDPFAATNRRGWVPWVDRPAIEALRTPTSVPALYGSVYDNGKPYGFGVRPAEWQDPYFAASSVVMDVANPAYREWHIRYLLYQLEDHGIEPGDSTCILSGYKPGIHTNYDDQQNGVSGKACSEARSGNWVGPAQVCKDDSAIGGPLHPTPFALGEYEAAISAYFREMTSTLAANGYSALRIITAEAPAFRDTTWSILADDVRRLPKMAGDQGGWIEPRLTALASLPPPGARASQPVEDESTEAAAAAADPSASEDSTTPASSATASDVAVDPGTEVTDTESSVATTPAAAPAPTPPVAATNPRVGGVVSGSDETPAPTTPVATTPAPTAPPSGSTASSGTPAPTPSFSIGSGPKSGISSGSTSFSDANYPGTTVTTPVAADPSPSVPSPVAGAGSDLAAGGAPPAAPAASMRSEPSAASKPAPRGHMSSGGSGGGGGTAYAPSLGK